LSSLVAGCDLVAHVLQRPALIAVGQQHGGELRRLAAHREDALEQHAIRFGSALDLDGGPVILVAPTAMMPVAVSRLRRMIP